MAVNTAIWQACWWPPPPLFLTWNPSCPVCYIASYEYNMGEGGGGSQGHWSAWGSPLCDWMEVHVGMERWGGLYSSRHLPSFIKVGAKTTTKIPCSTLYTLFLNECNTQYFVFFKRQFSLFYTTSVFSAYWSILQTYSRSLSSPTRHGPFPLSLHVSSSPWEL